MVIGVAGPYSAATEEERGQNLEQLNMAAARLLERGHIPLIGVNAALPVVERLASGYSYDAMMKISMAVIERCEALLYIGKSPGADRERDYIVSKGLSIYTSLEEVPYA